MQGATRSSVFLLITFSINGNSSLEVANEARHWRNPHGDSGVALVVYNIPFLHK